MLVSGVTLEKVLEEVKGLSLEEQRRLRDFLGAELLRPSSETKEEELDQVLLWEGIISEIPRPIDDLTPYRNRKLIKVKGKPMSETILEERR